MTKSLPERLRDVARNLPKYSGKAECCIADALYPDICDNFDCSPCDSCLIHVFESLATEVEMEYVEIPAFSTYEGRRLFLDTMEEMTGAKIANAVRVNAVGGSAESLKLVFEPPKDTLEAIEKDAGLYWGDYVAEHPHVTTQREMTLDLLRRQRKVLERDADE